MTNEINWAHASISPSQIDAVVRQARAERAEAMRVALAALPAKFKQLVGSFRPASQAVPHKGALA